MLIFVALSPIVTLTLNDKTQCVWNVDHLVTAKVVGPQLVARNPSSCGNFRHPFKWNLTPRRDGLRGQSNQLSQRRYAAGSADCSLQTGSTAYITFPMGSHAYH